MTSRAACDITTSRALSCDKLLELGAESQRRDAASSRTRSRKAWAPKTGDVLHFGHHGRSQGVVITHHSMIDRAQAAAQMEA